MHATTGSIQNVSDYNSLRQSSLYILLQHSFTTEDNKPFTANIVLSDTATFISPDKLTDITLEYRAAPIHMR